MESQQSLDVGNLSSRKLVSLLQKRLHSPPKLTPSQRRQIISELRIRNDYIEEIKPLIAMSNDCFLL